MKGDTGSFGLGLDRDEKISPKGWRKIVDPFAIAQKLVDQQVSGGGGGAKGGPDRKSTRLNSSHSDSSRMPSSA